MRPVLSHLQQAASPGLSVSSQSDRFRSSALRHERIFRPCLDVLSFSEEYLQGNSVQSGQKSHTRTQTPVTHDGHAPYAQTSQKYQ